MSSAGATSGRSLGGVLRPRRPESAWALVAVAAGIVLVVAGVLATWAQIDAPLNLFDEGLLVTGADHVLHHRWIFRDWYTPYPAGVYLLIAAVWKVLGTSALTYRLLGFVLHLGIGVLAGRLGGRMVGRGFSWPTAGFVLVWLSLLGAGAYAWILGLFLVLLAFELGLLARDRDRTVLWLAAGAAFGLLSTVRQDLFVYVGAFVVAGGALVAWRRGALRSRALWSPVRWLAVGAAVPMAIIWLPTLAVAGIGQTAADLVLDQKDYVQPAGDLPMPDLWQSVDGAQIGWDLPAIVSEAFRSAVGLTLIGPVLAAVALLLQRRRLVADPVAAALVGALALAVVPQVLNRTDPYHAFCTVTPSVILAVALVERQLRFGRPALRAAMLACGVVLSLALWPQIKTATDAGGIHLGGMGSRFGGLKDPTGAEAALADYFAQHTQPGDRTVVVSDQHYQATINAPGLYYIVNRRSAVRSFIFDIGLINREPVQKLVVDQMEWRKPQFIVGMAGAGPSIAPSVKPSSRLLDNYLVTHYGPAAGIGPFVVYERRPVPLAAPPAPAPAPAPAG